MCIKLSIDVGRSVYNVSGGCKLKNDGVKNPKDTVFT